MARYKAKFDGLAGTAYVRAGEVFDWDGTCPSWAEEVKPKAPAKKAPVDSEKKDGE
jgi:hypothetical protein